MHGCPILRKDFLRTRYEVAQSAAYGADAVLSILAGLSRRGVDRDARRSARATRSTCSSKCTTKTELARAVAARRDAPRHQQPRSADVRDRSWPSRPSCLPLVPPDDRRYLRERRALARRRSAAAIAARRARLSGRRVADAHDEKAELIRDAAGRRRARIAVAHPDQDLRLHEHRRRRRRGRGRRRCGRLHLRANRRGG